MFTMDVPHSLLRNDDISSGRKSNVFLTYGFKAFTSEKQPDNIKAKAFNERTFVIKCYPGYPDYDISEVIAGDDEYQTQFDDLNDFRKLLLVYRMLHFNDRIPNIKLTIKNRDKQLCKPLIRLFQDTKAVNEIKESLWKLLQEKKNRKANTLEARIYKIVNDLIKVGKPEQSSLNGDEATLSSDDIWTRFKAEIKGAEIKQSFDTEEFGLISRNKISSILEGRFLGESRKNSKGCSEFRFSKGKLEKIGANYSDEGIKIISYTKSEAVTVKQTLNGGSETSGALQAIQEHSEIPMVTENGDSDSIIAENTHNNASNVEEITNQTSDEDALTFPQASEASKPPLNTCLNDQSNTDQKQLTNESC